jgi:hypothetical protein
MDTTITRDQLSSLSYGRGAERLIARAQYAVITGTTAHPVTVLSTHTSYEAAERVLRKAARSTGHVHIAEIEG